MAGILVSDASNKGELATAAVDEFRRAILAKLKEAGLEVVEKRAQHPLAGDVLALASALNPEDPLGKGMARSRIALAELVNTIQRKRTTA